MIRSESSFSRAARAAGEGFREQQVELLFVAGPGGCGPALRYCLPVLPALIIALSRGLAVCIQTVVAGHALLTGFCDCNIEQSGCQCYKGFSNESSFVFDSLMKFCYSAEHFSTNTSELTNRFTQATGPMFASLNLVSIGDPIACNATQRNSIFVRLQ